MRTERLLHGVQPVIETDTAERYGVAQILALEFVERLVRPNGVGMGIFLPQHIAQAVLLDQLPDLLHESEGYPAR